MDPWAKLQRLLEVDSEDLGCAENLELIHTYAEMLVNGADPGASYSAVTAHLKQCAPCAEDFRGLVQAVQETLEGDA